MHHCLQISEIISQVCSELYKVDGAVTLVDLARLARTCRALCDPALDTLWHTLPSLDPLIRTLPADLWCIRDLETTYDSNGDKHIGDSDETFDFRRPMKQADWTRFCLYARRVRVLNFQDSSRKEYVNHFYPGVACALHVHAPTLPLLPNLQTLALHNDKSELVPHLGMLLHPTLTSFSRFVVPDTENLSLHVSFLMNLPVACPALTSLTVYSHCSKEEKELLIAAVSRVVVAWNGLTHLDVPSLTAPALEILSALPSLESLKLEHLELSDTQHAFNFPSLRSIKFGTSLLSTCIAFLSLLPRQHPLQLVQMCSRDNIKHPELCCPLFETLAKHCSPLALKVVDINSLDGSVPDNVVGMMEILTPLLPFHRLERLRVTLPAAVAFDDAAIRVIAVSWPRLRALEIWSGPMNIPGSHGISAAGFADLVTSCTDLCELCIIVDIAAPVAGAWTNANTSLRTLSVRNSTVLDIAGTAAFFSAVCPNLGVIYATQDYNSWQEVTRLVTMRRQETSELTDHAHDDALQ
ncbi:hypothetical protein PLICRDRAFT_52018 [Plicaturopsis crispa FD-325 SS-3]|nr:hypothetical protein PLICRDRAFT_52018 [Plicaturopsis crispa FD-325 SS-3]